MNPSEKNNYRITDLAKIDRPRERLASVGPGALTNAELVAILLRVGIKGENAVQMGQRLLHDLGGLIGIHRATYQQVCAQKGLGPAKAAQIKAAIELGNRLRLSSPQDLPQIQSPDDVYALVQYEMSGLTRENLWVLLLDTKNRVTEIVRLYQGSLNASTVRVGEIFKAAIQKDAAGVILVHNHPSGDPHPSPEDIVLTKAVMQAGKLMDIELLDHVVVGIGRYVSIKRQGLAFS